MHFGVDVLLFHLLGFLLHSLCRQLLVQSFCVVDDRFEQDHLCDVFVGVFA